MPWLIEAFLDEGKQGPDHPEGLRMKNKDDFDRKKKYEKDEKEKIERRAKERNFAFSRNIKKMNNHFGNQRFKNDVKNTTTAYQRVDNEEINRMDQGGFKTTDNDPYFYNRTAVDATRRNMRRHDKKLAKQHECADIIEILQ